jgi:hypothetical protein
MRLLNEPRDVLVLKRMRNIFLRLLSIIAEGWLGMYINNAVPTVSNN